MEIQPRHSICRKCSAARTLQHFIRLGLNVRPDVKPPEAYGSFEAREFGELWSGAGLHGSVVAGTTAVLLAFNQVALAVRPTAT